MQPGTYAAAGNNLIASKLKRPGRRSREHSEKIFFAGARLHIPTTTHRVRSAVFTVSGGQTAAPFDAIRCDDGLARDDGEGRVRRSARPSSPRIARFRQGRMPRINIAEPALIRLPMLPLPTRPGKHGGEIKAQGYSALRGCVPSEPRPDPSAGRATPCSWTNTRHRIVLAAQIPKHEAASRWLAP